MGLFAGLQPGETAKCHARPVRRKPWLSRRKVKDLSLLPVLVRIGGPPGDRFYKSALHWVICGRCLALARGSIMPCMATPSKSTHSSRAKRPSPRKSKAPKSSPKPSLRFYHSGPLRKRTLDLLDTVEGAQDATAHREALAEVVLELTRSGMEAYFLTPLKLAKAGFVVEQTASLGLMGAQQMMGPVIRQMIGRLKAPQLISVCGSIRQFML